jgi:sugar phosphate isomerase/epimerase
MRGLALAPRTVIDASPVETVMTAASADYQAVGLRLMFGDDKPLLAGTPEFGEVTAALAETGVTVLDVWVIGMRADTRATDYLPMFEAGARLGARYVNTVGIDADEGRIAEVYARLCEAAEPYNLHISLEFAKFLGVKSLEQAVRIVQQAGSPSAGICLDAMHLHRSGGTVDDVRRLDSSLVDYLQLCDAPAQSPPDDALLQEALYDRLYPGDGDLPLQALVAALPAELPISVETPSKRFAHESVQSRVRRSADAARAWLAAGAQG